MEKKIKRVKRSRTKPKRNGIQGWERDDQGLIKAVRDKKIKNEKHS
jgi:hypothetical protein